MFYTVATVTDKQASPKDGHILSENVLSRKEAEASGTGPEQQSHCWQKQVLTTPPPGRGWLQDAPQGRGAGSAGQRASARSRCRSKQRQVFQRGTHTSDYQKNSLYGGQVIF